MRAWCVGAASVVMGSGVAVRQRQSGMESGRLMKLSTVLSLMVGGVALSACMYSPRAQSPMQASSVWACHGDQSRQWQRVPVADADGHRSHGDRISNSRQDEGQQCDNASAARDRRGD
jgi:hypothetical protein